jgi:FtsZ-binding cell division protein ZapB
MGEAEMKYNQNKLLKLALIFLIIFLIIIQGLKIRTVINKIELLQSKISTQQQQNNNLQAEYLTKSRSSNLKSNNPLFDLKEKTAEILSELKSYNLELIDFSSSKAELNLNLSGDFSAILNFIYYLETDIISLKIDEFKIKKNSNQLFFYLKLKNGLI